MYSFKFVSFWRGLWSHTQTHVRCFMPLTFRFTLNKTAGRKGGDEADPTTDHRVTSKPWQKRRHSIAEGEATWGYKGHFRAELGLGLAVYVQISQMVTKVLIRQRFRHSARAG